MLKPDSCEKYKPTLKYHLEQCFPNGFIFLIILTIKRAEMLLKDEVIAIKIIELDGVWTVNKRETLKKLDMTRFHSLFFILVTGIHFFFVPQILRVFAVMVSLTVIVVSSGLIGLCSFNRHFRIKILVING
jgi:hypothetical protein